MDNSRFLYMVMLQEKLLICASTYDCLICHQFYRYLLFLSFVNICFLGIYFISDLAHVFSSIRRDLNFIDHTSDLGWKE